MVAYVLMNFIELIKLPIGLSCCRQGWLLNYCKIRQFRCKVFTRLHHFRIDFANIFWEGLPGPLLKPIFHSCLGFYLDSGFAINFRALRALDSGSAINSQAVRALDSGFLAGLASSTTAKNVGMLFSLPSYDTVTQWANSIVILKKVRPMLTGYIFCIQYKKKSAQCC